MERKLCILCAPARLNVQTAIKNMNEIYKYIPFLAVLAPFAMFFQQTKNIIIRFFSIIWKSRDVGASLTHKVLVELDKYPKYDFDDYQIQIRRLYNKESKLFELKNIRKNYNIVYFYKNIFPIFISSNDGYGLNISYVKFTFPFEKFIENLFETEDVKNSLQDDNEVDYFCISKVHGERVLHSSSVSYSPPYNGIKEKKERVVITNNGFNSIIHKTISRRSLNSYSEGKMDFGNKYLFTNEGLQVLNSVKKWKNNRLWYDDRCIRYYRGCLLHSRPGMGKSELIIQVAMKLKIPIYQFDLSSFDNKSLNKKIEELGPLKAIILFEDIDCVFNKRDNLTKTLTEPGVTFDSFINLLSGANSIVNKYVFMTTNNIDTIDEALIRPGRIDEKIELKSLNKEEKEIVANLIVKDENLAKKLADEGSEDTTAEFENRCVQESLKLLWN